MICVREGWKFRISNSIILDRVVEALGRFDIEAALRPMLEQNLLMDFVYDNAAKLREETIFEQALFWAYVVHHDPEFSRRRLIELFRVADAEQLRAIAHHRYLPEGKTITLYRGVVGNDREQRIGGISWTDNMETAVYVAACWAWTYGLEDPNPRVYTVEIPTEAVLLNIGSHKIVNPDGARGNELLVLPPIPGKIVEVQPEMIRRDVAKLIAEWKRGKQVSEKQWALLEAAGACDKQAQLIFVADHAAELHEAGLFEIVLVNAYLGKRWPNSPVSIVELFEQADPDKLRALGDPLPRCGSITLYRGVSGIGSHKRAGGLSWSEFMDVAAWHAVLNEFPMPAVYQMDVPTKNIAIKIGPEIIVLPRLHGQIRLVYPKIWRPTMRNLEVEKSLRLKFWPIPGNEKPEIIGARFTQMLKYIGGIPLKGQLPLQGYAAEITATSIWNFLQRRYGKKPDGAKAGAKENECR